MKKILLPFLSLAIMFQAISVFAQNLLPSPPPGLEGNREQIAKVLLDSKDEALLCKMIQQEGDDENINYLKMLASKRLSVYGTEKSIPTLLPMLSHPHMGIYARYALEPMPGKAVDEALREETKKQKGMALVGVLTTIGVRRDAGAIAFVQPLLTDADPEVVKAAYSALGDIGTPESADILLKALGDFKPEFDKAVCDAALDCAKILIAAKNVEKGLALYDGILKSKARPFLKEGAVFGRILARKNAGLADLVQYLHSKDAGLFDAALQTIRMLPADGTPDLPQALGAELDKFDPQRKGLVLEALAGRKDDASRKAALEIALKTTSPEAVYVSAMNALGTLDSPDAVLGLLKGARENGGEGPVAEAAFRSLSFVTNKDAGAAIEKALLAEGDKLDAVLIRVARERRVAAATPQLWAIAKDKNSPFQSEAVEALGETATLEDLADLARLLGAATDDNDKRRITIALSALCSRMPQQKSYDDILALLDKGEPVVKYAMIELLKTVGGKAAVDKVTTIALSDQPDMVDKATQVLGTWDSPDTMDDIAASLLRVAKESSEERFRIRGVRGYIRLARQFSYPENKRIEMIRTAFDTAGRVEDKNLIFEVFARYPSVKMLETVMEYAKEDGFKEQAFAGAVAVGAKLPNRSTRAAALMRQIAEQTTNAETKAKAEAIADKLSGVDEGVVIIKATYGGGEKQADVTEKVRNLSGGSTILDLGNYNQAFGDAAPGVVKTLKITYKIKDGAEKTVEFQENAPATLPK